MWAESGSDSAVFVFVLFVCLFFFSRFLRSSTAKIRQPAGVFDPPINIKEGISQLMDVERHTKGAFPPAHFSGTNALNIALSNALNFD